MGGGPQYGGAWAPYAYRPVDRAQNPEAGLGNGYYYVNPGTHRDGSVEASRYVPWSYTYRDPPEVANRYTDRPTDRGPSGVGAAERYDSRTGAPVNDFYRGNAQFHKADDNAFSRPVPPIGRSDEMTNQIYQDALRASVAQQYEKSSDIPVVPSKIPVLPEANITGLPYGRASAAGADVGAKGAAAEDKGLSLTLNAPVLPKAQSETVGAVSSSEREVQKNDPPYSGQTSQGSTIRGDSFSAYKKTGEAKELELPLEDVNTVHANRSGGALVGGIYRKKRLSRYQAFVRIFAHRHRGKFKNGADLIKAAANAWRK